MAVKISTCNILALSSNWRWNIVCRCIFFTSVFQPIWVRKLIIFTRLQKSHHLLPAISGTSHPTASNGKGSKQSTSPTWLTNFCTVFLVIIYNAHVALFTFIFNAPDRPCGSREKRPRSSFTPPVSVNGQGFDGRRVVLPGSIPRGAIVLHPQPKPIRVFTTATQSLCRPTARQRALTVDIFGIASRAGPT